MFLLLLHLLLQTPWPRLRYLHENLNVAITRDAAKKTTCSDRTPSVLSDCLPVCLSLSFSLSRSLISMLQTIMVEHSVGCSTIWGMFLEKPHGAMGDCELAKPYVKKQEPRVGIQPESLCD